MKEDADRIYQARHADLRKDMRALTHDAAVHDHLRAGELGRAPSRDGSVRWPVSAGLSWGLASAALVMAITTAVIAVADGDVFIVSLVPGSIGAALIGVLVAVRRRGQPMGTRRADQLVDGDGGVRYDVLARLGRCVEEAADHESALDCMVRTIADSLRLPYAAVELRLSEGWRPVAVYGEAPSEVSVFPLISQRETVGLLLVGTRAPGERLGPDDERLLADLARQAGPATQAVALRRALDASRADPVTMRERLAARLAGRDHALARRKR